MRLIATQQWTDFNMLRRISEESLARWCVIGALGLTLFVNIGFLVSNTAFGGDDWAWLWAFHEYGAGAVQHFVAASGHPGFGPTLNLVLYLGGQDAPRLAHIVMIAFHLANGWMVWRVFRESRCTPPLAATVAVLYLASPYLAGLHGSLAHVQYDVAIFFYLLSIWLSLRGGWVALALALAAALIGLSIETLMALEPLRWWALYRTRPGSRSAIRKALPFLVLALLVGLAREFWFVPSGTYAGYNSVAHAGLGDYLRRAVFSLGFFVNLRQPFVFAGSITRYENPFFPWVLLISAVLASTILWRSRPAADSDLILFFIVAGTILMLGMAPYVAINEIPSRVDVSSRFAVASQFGAIMAMAGGIQLIRFSAIRAAIFGLFVFAFMANQFQMGKWLLYEDRVVGDFRDQTAAYLAKSGDQLLVVNFEPPSRDFIYLNRACIGSYDMNVSLALANERGGSFAYDSGCPYRYLGKSDGCFITGFDPPSPCPPVEHHATFRLKPDLGPFTHFHMGTLLQLVISGSRLNAGDFIPAE